MALWSSDDVALASLVVGVSAAARAARGFWVEASLAELYDDGLRRDWMARLREQRGGRLARGSTIALTRLHMAWRRFLGASLFGGPSFLRALQAETVCSMALALGTWVVIGRGVILGLPLGPGLDLVLASRQAHGALEGAYVLGLFAVVRHGTKPTDDAETVKQALLNAHPMAFRIFACHKKLDCMFFLFFTIFAASPAKTLGYKYRAFEVMVTAGYLLTSNIDLDRLRFRGPLGVFIPDFSLLLNLIFVNAPPAVNAVADWLSWAATRRFVGAAAASGATVRVAAGAIFDLAFALLCLFLIAALLPNAYEAIARVVPSHVNVE